MWERTEISADVRLLLETLSNFREGVDIPNLRAYNTAQQGNHSKPMTESSTQSRWPFREFRAVRSERESAGEWTSEGGPNGKPSRDRRESHPLSIGARMMVRVSERTYKRQFGWYRRSISFCPMSGAKAVFYFRLAPAQPKRSSATQTFYIFGGTQNEERRPTI